jgi:hypothetical protein
MSRKSWRVIHVKMLCLKQGSKSDKTDARKLAELLRLNDALPLANPPAKSIRPGYQIF